MHHGGKGEVRVVGAALRVPVVGCSLAREAVLGAKGVHGVWEALWWRGEKGNIPTSTRADRVRWREGVSGDEGPSPGYGLGRGVEMVERWYK